MGKGSVLKNLKNDLQKNDLLRDQKRKKNGKEDKLQVQLRRERDQQSLASIREAFNPFNIKYNRGKSGDGAKTEGGRPVAARSQAEMQRRRTWEAEKRLKNKVGGFVDRRFGEKDKTMSEEDKMVERYAREKLNRMRKASKKSFNIDKDSDDDDAADDFVLTHGGQKLAFEDDFDEDDLGVEIADDDDDSGAPGPKRMKLDGSNAEEEERPARPKTKAEIMQEVIAKSKLHKLERQQQKANDEELVDNLNADFDDLMAELGQVERQSEGAKREVDKYDVNIQEFAFDKRADPKDRTKTDQELAEEAATKKRLAERAQQSRMEGDDLGVDYDTAGDDAELFGLRDVESDDDYESDKDASGDDEDTAGAERTENGYAKVNVPESYKDLRRVLDTEEISALPTKIRSFVKAATPGRGSGSEPQLHSLASALTVYACNAPSMPSFSAVVEILHEMCPKNEVGLVVANKCRDLVHRAHARPVWTRRELLLFALIGSLFSTSDQWHVVATSASIVITQQLSMSVNAAAPEVSRNLFLCDVLLDYQRLSKRYFPEVAGYLLRVLYYLNPEANRSVVERLVRIPPRTATNSIVLAAAGTDGAVGPDVEGVCSVSNDMTCSSSAEIAVIVAKIVVKAASLWRSLEAFSEIFEPVLFCLRNISAGGNRRIGDAVSRLEKLLKFSLDERKPLQLQEFRPVGIITHAPLFDENYNPEYKGYGLDPEQRELQKLKALHKKERKSTLREIRRDAEFEARQSLADKRRDMAAYHSKLKQLEGQINGEEGAERNAYEREKKKRGRR